MKPKSNKIFIVSMIIGALFVFGIFGFRSLYYAPTDEIPVSSATVNSQGIATSAITAETSTLGYPTRLNIPKLNINANVQKVGISRKGNMSTPNNFTDVGWYKYGTIPGGTGSAVIAGHVDNGLGLAAVFSKLSDLTLGDDIYITDDGGKILHFKVTGSQEYPFDAKVDEVFNQKDGKLLKLITCAGTFIPANRTHDKRLVVTAILAE